MALDRLPAKKVTVTLPGGRVVVMREPKGSDESAALREAGTNADQQQQVEWGLTMRCTESVDGEAVDVRAFTPEKFRDCFTGPEWFALRLMFQEAFYGLTAEEVESMRKTKRESVAG